MFDPGSVRFEGPLRPYVDSFWADLQRQGYSPLSAGNLLRVVAHFSRWLGGRRLSIEDLSEDGVARFLAYRRRERYTGFLTRRALRPLLEHLGRLGIVIRPAPLIETPAPWMGQVRPPSRVIRSSVPPDGSARAKYSFWPDDRRKPARRTRCQLEPRSVER